MKEDAPQNQTIAPVREKQKAITRIFFSLTIAFVCVFVYFFFVSFDILLNF